MSEVSVIWTDESRAGVDASMKRARRMTGETRRDCRGRNDGIDRVTEEILNRAPGFASNSAEAPTDKKASDFAKATSDKMPGR